MVVRNSAEEPCSSRKDAVLSSHAFSVCTGHSLSKYLDPRSKYFKVFGPLVQISISAEVFGPPLKLMNPHGAHC